VFLDVFAGVVHETDDVVVVERVEGHTSSAPNTHQMGSPKQSKLVRHRRFTEAHEPSQVAHTPLAVREGIDQPDAGWIAQQFEDVSDRVDSGGPEQTLLDGCEDA